MIMYKEEPPTDDNHRLVWLYTPNSATVREICASGAPGQYFFQIRSLALSGLDFYMRVGTGLSYFGNYNNARLSLLHC